MYLWVKAFHVIFMVAWFAGLFYLPRLFVYHAEASDTVGRERFKIMEKRLSILMSIAAYRAVVQLFSKPHLWERTVRGRSKIAPDQTAVRTYEVGGL